MAVGPEEARLKRLLKLSATTALIGIALTVSESQTLGGFVTVLATLSLVWNLHRFGRLGPDRGADSGFAP